MKKFIIFLFIVAIGIGVFFGIKSFSGNEDLIVPTEKPEEIVYKIVSIDRLSELPGNITADNQNEWLVVKVFGQNYDSINRLYNMYYFTFEDEEGNLIENSPNTLTDAILYGELAPNETISGTVVFSVPTGAKGKLIITDENFEMTQELTINKN